MAKVIGLGVALPIVAFLAATRYAGWSGHAFPFGFGGHKLIAEFTLLSLALAVIPTLLAVRAVRMRCQDLSVPDRPFLARYAQGAFMIGAIALVVIWCMPPGAKTNVQLAAAVLAAFAVLLIGVAALAAFLQGLFGSSRYGLFYGTSFRTLIPIFAIVVIVMGLGTRPFLLYSESRYLAQDTLIDTQVTGMSNAELKLGERLRQETLAAVAELDGEIP